jgi:excisionase family DNA binding protein
VKNLETKTKLGDVPFSFTVKEAAALLRVGKTALYDAVARKEVPNAGVGQSVRIPASFIAGKLGVEICSLPKV